MSNSVMDLLVRALLDGDQARSIVEARKLRDAGVGHGRIIAEGVEAAMAQLDAKCTVEQFNLLEIMLSGRAVMGVIKELYPPGAPPPRTKGTVVVGVLEGDVHDLGKNIVKMVLTANGYRVVDCGKDCPLARLVDTAGQEAALAVGISGLITTVIPQVRRVRESVIERGLGLALVKTLVEGHGGAIEVESPSTKLNAVEPLRTGQVGEGSTFTVRLPLSSDDGEGMVHANAA